MFNYHPAIKVFLVFTVCCLLCYMNYLLFNTYDFMAAVKDSWLIQLGAAPYLMVLLLFADYYWRKKMVVTFTVWIFLNIAVAVNGIMHSCGIQPSIAIQWTQSAALMVFTVLLIFSKDKFPNWLRIFSFANFLVLGTCWYFYFTEWWEPYQITIYILCFTPMLKAMVFVKDYMKQQPEVLDAPV
jgi:hypothetical protein